MWLLRNIIFSELDGELKKVALSTFLFAYTFRTWASFVNLQLN